MNINLKNLNPLEKEILSKLTAAAADKKDIRIGEAAKICGCSASKISKFVKKAGFDSYKVFMDYAEGKEVKADIHRTELERLKRYTENFDSKNVDAFIKEIDKASKIVIMGYGPSFYCAGYLEYKLRLLYNIPIMAVPDITSALVLMEMGTLVVILSTSGQFISFARLEENIKEKGGTVLMVTEEYHPKLVNEHEKIIFLTDSTQSKELLSHDKSRACTMIFIEEVIFELLKRRKNEK